MITGITDLEIIVLAGFLALLVIGVALMLSPVKVNEDMATLRPTSGEPRGGESQELAVFRQSIRRVQESNDAEGIGAGLRGRDERMPEKVDNGHAHESKTRASSADDLAPYRGGANHLNGSRIEPKLGVEFVALDVGTKDKLGRDDDGRSTEQQSAEQRIVGQTQASEFAEAGCANAHVAIETNSERRPQADIGDSRPSADLAADLSVLDEDLVAEVITGRTPLATLVESMQLLGDYAVRDYVTKDVIRARAVELRSGKLDAPSFFGHDQHRTSVNVNDILESFEADVVEHYLASRQFSHNYILDFFEDFLVVTILPGTSRMEFLILSPPYEPDDDAAQLSAASNRITELFLEAASGPGGSLALYEEVERLLGFLRLWC